MEERLFAVLGGDDATRRLIDAVNATGRVYITHTRLDDRFTIRVVIGNPRATDEHVARCWQLLKEAASGPVPDQVAHVGE